MPGYTPSVRYCPACKATFLSTTLCPRDGVRLTVEGGDPLLGEVLGSRYRILDRMAAGGMGQVYRAAHARIASQFAVKVLYGDLAQDPEMRRRFEREAEAASVLQSRYITRVIDFGETERGVLYLVMELISGPTLTDAVVRAGALDAARALRITRQIARGLSHAHERGVLHRDLKPDNVLLATEDDTEEVAKILDFGIARVREKPGVTQAGQVLGTPEYMAPEVFTGAEPDARADVYALGAILFQLVSGRAPYQAASIPELYKLHLAGALPATRVPVDAAVLGAVRALMAPAKLDRPPSARAALELLDAVVPAPVTRPIPLTAPAATAATVPTRTDATPEIAAAVGKAIRAAIVAGAPRYNAGDAEGCAQGYRACAESLLVNELAKSGHEALRARLTAALVRSAKLAPANAAWELRYGFDDVLDALGAQVSVDVSRAPARFSQSPEYPSVARQLELAARIGARRLQAGQSDAVGAYYTAFGEALRLRVTAKPGLEPIAQHLEQALRDAAQLPPQDTGVILGAALDALRFERARITSNVRAAGAERLEDCPRLPEIQQLLVQAIGVGASAYNGGDIEGCCRVYVAAAQRILSQLAVGSGSGAVRARLTTALEKAGAGTPDDGAWALRHAFDAVLEARRPGR